MAAPLVIMPVKDSLRTTEESIRAILASGYSLRVYDDYSRPENATRLDQLSTELGIKVIHLSEHICHPSPNYRWILIEAQREAIQNNQPLVIVESDVIVRPNTIKRMMDAVTPRTGLVAAITMDEQGKINFPYEYAQQIKEDGLCRKRLSFCCTLLSTAFLRTYDFVQLNPAKNWYDVHISHVALQMGFENILQISNPVLHKPHSSRPWKRLKYTNPILYYWCKLIQHRDRI